MLKHSVHVKGHFKLRYRTAGEESMSEKDSNLLKQESICFQNSIRWMLFNIDGKSKLESLDYHHGNLS